MKKKSGILFAAIAAILVLQLAYSVYYCGMKQNISGDCYLSYNLGNSEGFDALGRVYGNVWTPQQYADNVLSITDSTRFNLTQIWKNQEFDTHPPLYYLLLNMLCSVLQPEFIYEKSVAIGIGINLVFVLGATVLVYLCLKKLTGKPILACLGMLAAAVSPAVVETTTFIRMYAMANFFVMLIILWHITYWDGQIKVKSFILLFLACVAAILTHYYTLLMIFFIALWFGIRLLRHHRWKDAVCYAVATVGSVGVSLMIFPPMLKHIFMQGRGKQALDNLAGSSMWERTFSENGMLNLLNKMLLGGMLKWWIASLVVLGVVQLLLAYAKKKKIAVLDSPIAMLGFVIMAYFLLVTKIAAYLKMRYIYFICLPILILLVVLIDRVARQYGKRGAGDILASAAIIGLICATAFSIKPADYSFLYLDTKEKQEQIVADGVKNIVYIGDEGGEWKSLTVFLEFEMVDSICFTTKDMLDMVINSGFDAQPFYLYICDGDGYAAMQARFPDLQMEYRFASDYAKVYYCVPQPAAQ